MPEGHTHHGLTLRAGDTVLQLDAADSAVSVRHRDHPNRIVLGEVKIASVVVDGEQHEPTAPAVHRDVDEVELAYRIADRVQVVVRHTVATGWGLRVSFANLSRETVELTDIVIGLHVGPDAVGWALVAGVDAAYSVHPLIDDAPVLGGVLQLGSVDAVTADGLVLTRTVLAPGARYVVQWLWDFFATPHEFGQGRHPQVPLSLVQTVGEVVEVRRDDDVALIATGLEIVEAADQLELVSDREGRFDVEQRSARGTTKFELSWVLPVEAVLADGAEQLLDGPRTSAGVVRLAGVSEALVLQHALSQTLITDTDGAADALDRFAALTDDETLTDDAALTDDETLTRDETQVPLDRPLLAAFGAGEFQRTGDPEALASAVRRLRATTAPVPGLGLAASQACLGLLSSGGEVEPLLHHLDALTGAGLSGDEELTGDPVREAAELELLAVTWTSPSSARPARGDEKRAAALIRRADRLGRWLGAGLKGRGVIWGGVEEVAHLSAVMMLLPDLVGHELSRRWGCSPTELAARSIPAVVDRLAVDGVGRAQVWLMHAQPPG